MDFTIFANIEIPIIMTGKAEEIINASYQPLRNAIKKPLTDIDTKSKKLPNFSPIAFLILEISVAILPENSKLFILSYLFNFKYSY